MSEEKLPEIVNNQNIDQQDQDDRQDLGSANSFNKRNSMQGQSMNGT